MEVQVTRDHIDAGVDKSCYQCPIALAITEKKYIVRAVVGLRTVNIVWAGDNVSKLHQYMLPAEACTFIDDFDFGNGVKPFSFIIDTNIGL